MTIHVLGLGETLDSFTHDGNTTIGVNDINSKVETDFVVCVDPPGNPISERMEAIGKTKCKGFYSQLECWSNVENFKKFQMISPRGAAENIDEEGLIYSVTSPFVAACLAYKMGAKRIVLWGVDLVSHYSIHGQLREIALKDFRNLGAALTDRGVELLVGDSFSSLSEFLGVYTPDE